LKIPWGDMTNLVDESAIFPQPHNLCILLIDDDELISSLMAEFLDELEHTTTHIANSGQQGLDIFANCLPRPNLLLCDLCMHGMDGFQFLAKVAQMGYVGDVIIMSGHDHQPPNTNEWHLSNYNGSVLHLAEKMARLQGLKVRATLEKPVSKVQLVGIVSQIRQQQINAKPALKNHLTRSADHPN
jgi:CheY-like chemotaxis protein